jgi:hypothetical protein
LWIAANELPPTGGDPFYVTIDDFADAAPHRSRDAPRDLHVDPAGLGHDGSDPHARITKMKDAHASLEQG